MIIKLKNFLKKDVCVKLLGYEIVDEYRLNEFENEGIRPFASMDDREVVTYCIKYLNKN